MNFQLNVWNELGIKMSFQSDVSMEPRIKMSFQLNVWNELGIKMSFELNV